MSSSNTMDLENLQLKYTNLVAQYKSAVYEYTTFVSQEGNKQELVAIQGYAFNGTGVAAQSRSSNLQTCQAECARLPNCTGATFVSNRCSLRKGDSPILSANKDSYAIIPKRKQLLLNMENINKELIDVNIEIVNRFKMGGPIIDRNITENQNNTNYLTKNYQKLIAERDEILDMLSEYETLESSEDQNQINITQNYHSYFLLSILAIAMLFLLYTVYSQSSSGNTSTVQYGGKLTMGTYYVIFFMILFITLIKYFYI